MSDVRIRVGQVWKHYKGDRYRIIAIARDEKTNVLNVVYIEVKSTSNDVAWSRSVNDFLGYSITQNFLVDSIRYFKRFELEEDCK
jgi:hypothetical protein